jgi:hypothetical protein
MHVLRGSSPSSEISKQLECEISSDVLSNRGNLFDPYDINLLRLRLIRCLKNQNVNL